MVLVNCISEQLKIKDRCSVEVDTKKPKVAYKETISGKAEGIIVTRDGWIWPVR